MSDSLAVFILILLVLSLASERLADLIKLNILKLKSNVLSVSEEEYRARRVAWIVLGSSLIMACLSRADFLHFIQNREIATIMPEDLQFKHILGYLLSALMLSFLAKFWHGLISSLARFAKLLSVKITRERQLTATSINELSEAKKLQLAKKIKASTPRLQTIKGYSGYRIVTYQNGRTVAQLLFRSEISPPEEWTWVRTILENDFELMIDPKAQH